MTSDILQAVAQHLANDACCGITEGGECCMTPQAREVFTAMNRLGGPSLAECEAIARGEVKLVRIIPEAEKPRKPLSGIWE